MFAPSAANQLAWESCRCVTPVKDSYVLLQVPLKLLTLKRIYKALRLALRSVPHTNRNCRRMVHSSPGICLLSFSKGSWQLKGHTCIICLHWFSYRLLKILEIYFSSPFVYPLSPYPLDEKNYYHLAIQCLSVLNARTMKGAELPWFTL